MPDSDFDDADLARWLQEAGRRRVARNPGQALPELIGAPAAPAQAQPLSRPIRHPRVLLLFALAALSYFPYFFADVYVQISSLPCVIVFV